MYIEPTYVIEGTSYVFYLNGQRMFETPTVGILFDKDNGVLLKHGLPESVQASFDNYKAKLSHTEVGQDLLRSLVMVEGKFSVEDLNKAVNISGYAGKIFENLPTSQDTLH